MSAMKTTKHWISPKANQTKDRGSKAYGSPAASHGAKASKS